MCWVRLNRHDCCICACAPYPVCLRAVIGWPASYVVHQLRIFWPHQLVVELNSGQTKSMQFLPAVFRTAKQKEASFLKTKECLFPHAGKVFDYFRSGFLLLLFLLVLELKSKEKRNIHCFCKLHPFFVEGKKCLSEPRKAFNTSELLLLVGIWQTSAESLWSYVFVVIRSIWHRPNIAQCVVVICYRSNNCFLFAWKVRVLLSRPLMS